MSDFLRCPGISIWSSAVSFKLGAIVLPGGRRLFTCCAPSLLATAAGLFLA